MSANGDDIEFRILKNVLIDAIQIGLDKLKSSNSQGRDNDNSTTDQDYYYDGCFKPSKNCIRTVPGTNLIVNVLPVLLSRTLCIFTLPVLYSFVFYHYPLQFNHYIC